MASVRGKDAVVLATVLAAVLMAVLTAATTAITPSVTYIASKTFGDFFMAPGMSLTLQDARMTVSLKNNCECRMACWSAPWCMAAATLPNNLTCLLTDKGPLNSTLQDVPGAVYIFWKASVPGQYNEAMPDGLLYVELTQGMTFALANETCARLPGHRLGVYKTLAQNKAMLLLYNMKAIKGMLVNLRKTPEGTDRTWGDGSLFSAWPTASQPLIDLGNVSSKPIYTLYKNQLLDKEEFTGSDRVVCQANPRGIVW